MELADRAVGFLLSLISLSIFTYCTFWVIILVILPCTVLLSSHVNYCIDLLDLCSHSLIAIISSTSTYCPRNLPSSYPYMLVRVLNLLPVFIHPIRDVQIQEEGGITEISVSFFFFYLFIYFHILGSFVGLSIKN